MRHLQRLEGLTSFFLRRLFGYARLICYVGTISALALKAHIESMASICLLPATNVTAPAIPVLCIEADFDHTFFVDDSGLPIIQPLDQHPQTGGLVKIARWDDADPPHLVAHTPEETDVDQI